MRKIVSNTTPIISLLKISRLSVLQELYGEIFVPHAVFEEIEAGEVEAIKPLLIELRQKEAWINEKLMNEVLKLSGE